MPGKARDIGIRGGMIWAIGTNDMGAGNYGISRWNGNGWSAIEGGGVRIAVGPRGLPWVVKADGSVWKWDGTKWNALPLGVPAIDIAVSIYGTFIVGQDHEIYQLDFTNNWN